VCLVAKPTLASTSIPPRCEVNASASNTGQSCVFTPLRGSVYVPDYWLGPTWWRQKIEGDIFSHLSLGAGDVDNAQVANGVRQP